MAAKSHDLENALLPFLPGGSVHTVGAMLREYPHDLVITKGRATKNGDFRYAPGERYKITVNHNLNRYAFLITLMHELAHLICHVRYGNKVKPHGEEWKKCFQETLAPFIHSNIFPLDLEQAIKAYMSNPAAATCSDVHLSRVLAQYDRKKHENIVMVEDLQPGVRFLYGKTRREFEYLEKRRQRISCKETATGAIYLFPALTKVWKIND